MHQEGSCFARLLKKGRSRTKGAWLVPSQSAPGTKYRVTIGAEPTCECEDFQLRREACKHVIAARIVAARDGKGKAPEIAVDAVPKRPTYTQDWPLYNEAQQTEKHRFQELLFDLCRGLVDVPRPGRGRQRTPMADQVFAAAFKVYSTFSARRFACDLRDTHKRGYLRTLMNSVSVCAYLEDDALTPILQRFIVQSSLPLKAVETVFAPDSSGFSTSRFVRWYDEKYGVERSGHDWIKAHVMTGVKTNIVTAVTIEGRDAGDSPQLKPLLETTAANFAVKEVPADKAYLSHDNLDLVAAHGGTAYVPFKVNSVPGEAGTLWERMFHFYSFNREAFLKHYHQRSNVESTFSMVKAKFRDHVRSRTDTAMRNEVLCKFLCHNLCVVHQSHVELGIEPVFWQNGEAKQEQGPAILPMVRSG